MAELHIKKIVNLLYFIQSNFYLLHFIHINQIFSLSLLDVTILSKKNLYLLDLDYD